MRRTSRLLAAVAALSLALAPGLADARAGGGKSSGSRGSQTYSAPPTTNTAPTAAQPMQRTNTAPNTPSAAMSTPAGGMSRGSGFASGLMGGLIGVGLGGLLFGSGLFGAGLGGFAGFLGLLLQIGLIAGLIYFVVRWFRRRQAVPAMAGGPNLFARGTAPEPQRPVGGGGGYGAPPAPEKIQISEQDFSSFERLLQNVQAAWSRHDMDALRAMATPEMAGYFSEQLAEQTNRGVRNEVLQVQLLQGDLAEAWREGTREFATVAMRFGMVDVTRDAAGRVVDGSPSERAEATEIWTFVRLQGGPWLLSAIQQVR